MEAVDLGAENDERMARLRAALTLGQGFQLVIVQVEPGDQREEVLRRLTGWSERNAVPRLELMRLAPGESPVTRLVGDHTGVILAGLEAQRDDRIERPRQLIAELNWSRDRLPELVHGPLILVVSQRVQTALFEQAPDFYSWRAHSTSIVPHQPWVSQGFRWFDEDPANPAELEAMIAAAKLLRPVPKLEIARLHERLARARAIRGEFRAADLAFDAAHDGYVRAGTTDDRVELLLLRASIGIGRGCVDEASIRIEDARQEGASGTPSLRVTTRLRSAGAILSFYRGDPSAEHELEHAVVAFQALGDDGEVARLMHFRALLALRRGEATAGATLLEEALDLYRRARDPLGEALMLMMLAGAAAGSGRSDDAERYGVASVARAEATGSADMVARARATLAQIALANGHLEVAGDVLQYEVAAADPGASAQLAEARGLLALRRGELAIAKRFLHAALEAHQRRGTTWSIANVSLELGRVGRQSQDWALARTGFETADRLGDARQRALAAFGLAGIAYARKQWTASLADQLSVAAQKLMDAGNVTLADTAREHRGAVLLTLGRDLEARQELELARSGFEARGQAECAARAQALLAQLDRRGQTT